MSHRDRSGYRLGFGSESVPWLGIASQSEKIKAPHLPLTIYTLQRLPRNQAKCYSWWAIFLEIWFAFLFEAVTQAFEPHKHSITTQGQVLRGLAGWRMYASRCPFLWFFLINYHWTRLISKIRLKYSAFHQKLTIMGQSIILQSLVNSVLWHQLLVRSHRSQVVLNSLIIAHCSIQFLLALFLKQTWI